MQHIVTTLLGMETEDGEHISQKTPSAASLDGSVVQMGMLFERVR